MSLALVQSALLLPLELAINQLLSLDTASRAQLSALAGNTLAIELQRPTLNVFITVQPDRLRLSSQHDGAVSATLLGSPMALSTLLLQRQSPHSLQGTGVELRGDIAFVQSLQNLLLNLHIDWEFQLSRFIGDIPTQMMADGLRNSSDYLQRIAERTKQDISDYLLEEGRVVPSQKELEQFADSVQSLTLRIDRLATRMTLLDR